ncbi:cold shock-like protein CspLB [Listeria monocytogenes]|nr:cold shock-like protein CspLB [Listeria monocytogenes]GAT38331.1 cold shock-like protein CspLB [Listeria monocytogenes]GAT40345.1 cold shock-like protein CspLB [Listeria monocytogenes]
MYEYIISAFYFDETEAFFTVKPFNCTCLHISQTSKNFLNMFLLLTKKMLTTS